MLLADVGILPIIFVWAALFIIGRLKVSAKVQHPPSGGAPPAAGAQGGMMDELRRAMEELKRAEMTQIAREQHSAPSHPVPAARPSRGGDERAKDYLKKRLRVDTPRTLRPPSTHHAAPDPRVRSRLMAPVQHAADDEGSLETQEERTDYDLDVERMAAERRAQTEMQWHLGQAAAGAAAAESPATSLPPPAARGPLARYADGSARSALVLSMILGRPRSE